jgi:hypothetical protein
MMPPTAAPTAHDAGIAPHAAAPPSIFAAITGRKTK